MNLKKRISLLFFLVSIPSFGAEGGVIDQFGHEKSMYLIGAGVGTFVGLGAGHALQDTYWKRGWIYSVGEVGSIALIVSGATNYSSTNNVAPIAIGVSALTLFRIIEVLDVWLTFASKAHEKTATEKTVSFYVSPVIPNATVGLNLGMQIPF